MSFAVEISAKAETNLDKLLEAILLQAELLDLKANPEQRAEGVVLEAKLERGRGPVATLLVQRGTLREGETVVAGCECGHVHALLDERGERIGPDHQDASEPAPARHSRSRRSRNR